MQVKAGRIKEGGLGGNLRDRVFGNCMPARGIGCGIHQGMAVVLPSCNVEEADGVSFYFSGRVGTGQGCSNRRDRWSLPQGLGRRVLLAPIDEMTDGHDPWQEALVSWGRRGEQEPNRSFCDSVPDAGVHWRFRTGVARNASKSEAFLVFSSERR